MPLPEIIMGRVSPENETRFQITTTFFGAIGIVMALASQYFGTLSPWIAGVLGLGSCSLFLGGMTGYIGFVSLPIIIGIGLLLSYIPNIENIVYVRYDDL